MNVRGIRDQVKRRSIFTYLKDQKANVYFLQETYSELNDEKIWQNEWGGKMYFSHGSRHSKGTCILIDPSTNCNVDYSFSNTTGRIVLITVNIKGSKISCCNIYAPNNPTEQLEFIQELNNIIIDKSELTNLIVGGDWNCTLTKKDKRGGAPWKPSQFSQLLLVTMEIFDLVDIQRVRHPNLKVYSYVSKALNIKSRLDFFLIAKNLSKHVKNTGIKTSIAPDHKTVSLCLSWPDNSPRGPGFWKFNNTLLEDDNYLFKIRELLPRLRKKYDYLEDKRLVWELIKMEIRENTISFTKRKAKAAFKREMEISKRLDELDHKMCNSDNVFDMDQILNEYENLKTEIQSIYEEKGHAAIFRSKCRWVEKGERPTKYFFNLEKQNYSKKTITELGDDDNDETIKEEAIILETIEKFYEDLYSSKTTVSQEAFEEFIKDTEIPKLNNEDQNQMEGPLTLEECKKMLETFKDNKSPGEDGLTAESYKHFFDLIGIDLIESLNQAFKDGELSISQRRGVITLIPKEDSNLLDLQNWRPITLLNIDYKIASKTLAKRIESVLPKLVHTDQTGFMKGRYIGENLRLINYELTINK